MDDFVPEDEQKEEGLDLVEIMQVTGTPMYIFETSFMNTQIDDENNKEDD